MKNFCKKTLFLSLVLTIAMGTFLSCSDDDDKDSGSFAAKVAGTYVGSFTSVEFKGEIDLVVTVASDNEVLVAFDSKTGIAPYKVKLIDTGVQEIIQTSGNPICQFYSQTGAVIINDISKIYTFSGDKK